MAGLVGRSFEETQRGEVVGWTRHSKSQSARTDGSPGRCVADRRYRGRREVVWVRRGCEVLEGRVVVIILTGALRLPPLAPVGVQSP